MLLVVGLLVVKQPGKLQKEGTVRLYEMRPEKQTDAHHTGNLAE